ncbi:hydrolase 1, exosortase A system-associated [Erythrobacter sp. HL-111]|uniref:hydrolase 1, exosortase A system-associated n=1 Tax=Erythrobacter sp. HL-111 TaxID=1798193 RepID=UPI0006DB7E40|nr:hydrolase 1, exosortase A system-associated [Erythrobacter sp. HL-111]KPP96574.1 MAG: Lysophospholipase [Erythrobacteraceae bacterium HL-111]SDS03534.1 exosortase A system-associated hydrolase 1 [Erythrobacter sp. HL-111]
MRRLPLDFGCGELKLAGTLDTAPGTTGLLIVSGGNEIRSGAFSGQSLLAARIARAGFPVFRFDRRGIGDSEGENSGFRHSRRDIAAALEAFRAMAPQIDRVIGFGNCDAASALMLAEGAGLDGLVLSNPWTIEGDPGDAALPPSAIRARYAEKLANPREVLRLLRGGVDLARLGRGLVRSLAPAPAPSSLAEEMRAGLAAYDGPVRILLATGDRTAQVFAECWDAGDPRIARCDGAGHAYDRPEHREWLDAQILAALRS